MTLQELIDRPNTQMTWRQAIIFGMHATLNMSVLHCIEMVRADHIRYGIASNNTDSIPDTMCLEAFIRYSSAVPVVELTPDEKDQEIGRLREKLRQTKRNMRQANRGAHTNCMAWKIATSSLLVCRRAHKEACDKLIAARAEIERLDSMLMPVQRSSTPPTTPRPWDP